MAGNKLQFKGVKPSKDFFKDNSKVEAPIMARPYSEVAKGDKSSTFTNTLVAAQVKSAQDKATEAKDAPVKAASKPIIKVITVALPRPQDLFPSAPPKIMTSLMPTAKKSSKPMSSVVTKSKSTTKTTSTSSGTTLKFVSNGAASVAPVLKPAISPVQSAWAKPLYGTELVLKEAKATSPVDAVFKQIKATVPLKLVAKKAKAGVPAESVAEKVEAVASVSPDINKPGDVVVTPLLTEAKKSKNKANKAAKNAAASNNSLTLPEAVVKDPVQNKKGKKAKKASTAPASSASEASPSENKEASSIVEDINGNKDVSKIDNLPSEESGDVTSNSAAEDTNADAGTLVVPSEATKKKKGNKKSGAQRKKEKRAQAVVDAAAAVVARETAGREAIYLQFTTILKQACDDALQYSMSTDRSILKVVAANATTLKTARDSANKKLRAVSLQLWLIGIEVNVIEDTFVLAQIYEDAHGFKLTVADQQRVNNLKQEVKSFRKVSLDSAFSKRCEMVLGKLQKQAEAAEAISSPAPSPSNFDFNVPSAISVESTRAKSPEISSPVQSIEEFDFSFPTVVNQKVTAAKSPEISPPPPSKDTFDFSYPSGVTSPRLDTNADKPIAPLSLTFGGFPPVTVSESQSPEISESPETANNSDRASTPGPKSPAVDVVSDEAISKDTIVTHVIVELDSTSTPDAEAIDNTTESQDDSSEKPSPFAIALEAELIDIAQEAGISELASVSPESTDTLILEPDSSIVAIEPQDDISNDPSVAIVASETPQAIESVQEAILQELPVVSSGEDSTNTTIDTVTETIEDDFESGPVDTDLKDDVFEESSASAMAPETEPIESAQEANIYELPITPSSDESVIAWTPESDSVIAIESTEGIFEESSLLTTTSETNAIDIASEANTHEVPTTASDESDTSSTPESSTSIPTIAIEPHFEEPSHAILNFYGILLKITKDTNLIEFFVDAFESAEPEADIAITGTGPEDEMSEEPSLAMVKYDGPSLVDSTSPLELVTVNAPLPDSNVPHADNINQIDAISEKPANSDRTVVKYFGPSIPPVSTCIPAPDFSYYLPDVQQYLCPPYQDSIIKGILQASRLPEPQPEDNNLMAMVLYTEPPPQPDTNHHAALPPLPNYQRRVNAQIGIVTLFEFYTHFGYTVPRTFTKAQIIEAYMAMSNFERRELDIGRAHTFLIPLVARKKRLQNLIVIGNIKLFQFLEILEFDKDEVTTFAAVREAWELCTRMDIAADGLEDGGVGDGE